MSDDAPVPVDDTRAEFGLLWAGIFFVLGILFVAAFLWPTPWEYTWAEDGRVLIRRNRFSNRIEVKRLDNVMLNADYKPGTWVQIDPVPDE